LGFHIIPSLSFHLISKPFIFNPISLSTVFIQYTYLYIPSSSYLFSIITIPGLNIDIYIIGISLKSFNIFLKVGILFNIYVSLFNILIHMGFHLYSLFIHSSLLLLFLFFL